MIMRDQSFNKVFEEASLKTERDKYSMPIVVNENQNIKN